MLRDLGLLVVSFVLVVGPVGVVRSLLLLMMYLFGHPVNIITFFLFLFIKYKIYLEQPHCI